jgi:hypothetical protein
LGDHHLTSEQGAGDLDRNAAWVAEVIESLRKRSALVTDTDVATQLKEELLQGLDRWEKIAEPGKLSYSKRGLGIQKKGQPPPDRRYLLGEQEAIEHEGVFTAPGSLREVESEVHVYLADVSTAKTEDDE